MDLEHKMQLIAMAASAGPETDVDAIARQLARMATPGELESIASGGCSPETRITLYQAASLARRRDVLPPREDDR